MAAKVLLIAEQANPEWVSVPLVGWSLATAIAGRVPALIATHVRNREAFLRAGQVEGRHFIAIDNENVAAPMHKLSQVLRGGAGKGWTAVTALESLSYYAFEKELWNVLGSRIASHEFSLVHRITPLSPTAASPIAARCEKAGIPFIVGPLNGGLPWPPGFAGRRIAEREWLSYVREAYKLMPGYRATRQKAAAIIVASRATEAQLEERYRAKSFYLPENGIRAEDLAAPVARVREHPIRALFVGRFVPYKCPDLLLKSAEPLLAAGELRLTFVGGGPLEDALHDAVAGKSWAHAVEFKGWLPRAQVFEEMSRSDLLVLPSIREFGGGVVLEAMARGLPSLVANYGGPAELIDADTGRTFDFDGEESLIANLRQALKHLVAEPEDLERMSQNCFRKASNDYTWDAKAAKLTALYEKVLSERTDRVNAEVSEGL